MITILDRMRRPHANGLTAAPTIAVVGGGAAAQSYHLPALARHPGIRERMVLVERDPVRGVALAAQYGVRLVHDLDDVLGEIDAAVIATPAGSHHALTLSCIRRGVHVLCEKPLAETAVDAAELAFEAERAGVTVAVNHARRLIPSYRRIRELLAEGAIGSPRHFSLSWGEVFAWPSATGALFGASGAGRGVLLDLGAHALDLACWWLDGQPRIRSFHDDAMGGTEAVAALTFDVGNCTGDIWLSWLSNRRNEIRIEGERGTIVCGLYDWDAVTLIEPSGRQVRMRTEAAPEDYDALTALLIENFLETLAGRAEPVVTARDAVASLRAIDDCYAIREPFDRPWHDAWRRVGVCS